VSRFALQTFTVRKYLKSPAAIDSGFARIRKTGLQVVELAYVKLKPPEMDAVEQACKTHGITVGSSQITFDILDRQRDWVLKLHEQLQCRITAVSVLPFKVIRGERDQMLRFAEQLEALGQFYRGHGLQLCFHHHDFEFRHYGDDVGLDLLLANTSPENVGLELDTYWVARGGRSPQDMIDSLQGRVKVVHLRDYRLQKKLLGVAPVDAALGRGNLDFSRIIDSCLTNKVHYMAIEQATDQPFEQVAISVSHLHQLGYNALF
jgi:sugar phosphate isomerase/epimerase